MTTPAKKGDNYDYIPMLLIAILVFICAGWSAIQVLLALMHALGITWYI